MRIGTASKGRRSRALTISLCVVAIALSGLPVVGLSTGVAAAAPVAAWTAYVANLDSDTVTPINTATNTAGPPIAVGDGPDAIAITPDGLTAYVVNELSQTVTPINTVTNTVGAGIPVGADPTAIAITPDGSKAFVANEGDGTVTPIDTVTNTAGAPISCGCSARTIAISTDGATAWAWGDTSQNVVPINTATGVPGAPIPTFNAQGSTILPDGSTLYGATFTSGSIAKIDTATHSQLGPIQGFGPGFQLPFSIAASPDGTKVYWTDSNSFATHDLANPFENPVITPLVATGQLHGMALTPDGAMAYVANSIDNTVTPINIATKTLGTPISVGQEPWAVAITPDQAPVAHLSVTQAPVGSPTTFDASASTVTYGTIASYTWDFGDGTTDTTTTPTTTHTYSGGGFTASVVETSSGGTSLARVFTGQTVLRNGGLRAGATALGSGAVAGAPIVYQVTPAAGGLAGGTAVSIIGSGFTGATSVTFGGVPATGVTVNGDNSISATTPAASGPMTVDVVVTNGVGPSTTSPADRFRYLGTVAPVTVPCTQSFCAVQFGTVDMSTTVSTNTACNTCTIGGGIILQSVPPTCPDGQSPQLVMTGWVEATQNQSVLSSLTASISYQMTLDSFDAAAKKFIRVCYINGVPTQVPTGSASRLQAAAMTTAAAPAPTGPKPFALSDCTTTNNAPPCILSKTVDGNTVHITMLLPPGGSTFQVVADPVKIRKLSHLYGRTGTPITITGTNMATVTSAAIGGVEAPITNRTADRIVITIPDGAQTGPVTLQTLGGPVTSPMSIAIGPTITRIPPSGRVGTKVTISGFNLMGATGVAFNGTPGTIVSTTDTRLVARVPAGATAGPITVTTPDGTATSPTTFTPLPR